MNHQFVWNILVELMCDHKTFILKIRQKEKETRNEKKSRLTKRHYLTIEDLQAKKEHLPVFIGKYIPEKLQSGARKLIRKE